VSKILLSSEIFPPGVQSANADLVVDPSFAWPLPPECHMNPSGTTHSELTPRPRKSGNRSPGGAGLRLRLSRPPAHRVPADVAQGRRVDVVENDLLDESLLGIGELLVQHRGGLRGPSRSRARPKRCVAFPSRLDCYEPWISFWNSEAISAEVPDWWVARQSRQGKMLSQRWSRSKLRVAAPRRALAQADCPPKRTGSCSISWRWCSETPLKLPIRTPWFGLVVPGSAIG
jgi:hypothetical protein